MWKQKSPDEVAAEKRVNLLRNSCWVALLWACLWYGLLRLRPYFGRSLQDASVDLMGLALVGSILFVWRLSWQAHQKNKETLVCDRCNSLKSADGQLTCKCGGQYLTLLQMKWTAPEKQPRPPKSAEQTLSPHTP
jgi:hypothetical protein